MNHFRRFLFCTVLAVFTACVSQSFAAEPEADGRGKVAVLDPAGVWSFTLASNVAKNFSRTFKDELLTGGTIYVAPPADATTTYTYTLSGDTISILYEVKDNGGNLVHEATYMGTLTSSTMSGTYVVLDGAALEQQDMGSWSAKRAPSTFAEADATAETEKIAAGVATVKYASSYKIAASIMLPSTFDLTTLTGTSTFQLVFGNLKASEMLSLDSHYVPGATKATLLDPTTGTTYVLDWSKITTLTVTISGKATGSQQGQNPPVTTGIIVEGGLGAVDDPTAPGVIQIPAQFTFGTYSKTLTVNAVLKYKISLDSATGGSFSIASKVAFPKGSTN